MILYSCLKAVEITYSTACSRHEIPAWLRFTWMNLVWFTCISFTMKALAAAALGLHGSSCIMIILYEVMLWLHYGYVMVMLWLLLWLLHQPGSCVMAARPSRGIINVSAVPTVLPSPSSVLACALPTLGSANSGENVNSKASWLRNRINYIICIGIRIPSR